MANRLLGKLTINVIEARGLRADDSCQAYCLVQYDRCDSVSREWGAVRPPPKEAKRGGKTPGARRGRAGLTSKRVGGGGPSASKPVNNSSSTTSSSVSNGAPLVKRQGFPGLAAEEPEASSSSSRVSSASASSNEGDDSDGDRAKGTPDSPVWNHKALFDVVDYSRTMLICVYDKNVREDQFPAHGFLGAVVVEPILSPDIEQDAWLPLSSFTDPSIGGQVRVLVSYERLDTRPKMSVGDFQVLRRIGEGSFGQVFKVRKKDTRRVYAMKVIAKSRVANSSELQHVLAERRVLQRTLDSPFLVGLKFSFQSPTDLFLVMDYKSGGELFAILQRDGGRFEEDRVRFYLAEILLGLKFLHAANIIYRDLKPENCLLDGSGHVVLVDFGLSKLIDSEDGSTRTFCGTTEYMAPEILLNEPYNRRADIWSFGILLYEASYGWSPFYSESRVEKYEKILSSPIKIPKKIGCSAEHTDLLLKLLERDPNQRLGSSGGVEEIQAHPFFGAHGKHDAIDWQALSTRSLTPPFKPPVVSDDDDILADPGRNGAWFFSSTGAMASNGSSAMPSRAHSSGDNRSNGSASAIDMAQVVENDNDPEGLYRGFSFNSRWAEQEGPTATTSQRRSSWAGELP